MLDQYVSDLWERMYYYDIMRLLQVCKRWKSLITNSPMFWTRIRVNSTWMLFDLFTRKSILPYISSCLKYSRDMPMDVSLNFEDLSEDLYIKRELTECARAIIDHRRGVSVEQMIHDLPWNFESPSYHRQLERALVTLVGKNGENSQRWNSLSIQFPQKESIAGAIFARLAKYTDNLTALSVYNFPNNWLKRNNPETASFKSLKSLRLHTRDFSFDVPWWQMLNLSPISLEELAINTNTRLDNLIDLSIFSNLRQLRMECGRLAIAADHRASFTISLPNLSTLWLTGEYSNLGNLQLDFPALNSLEVTLNATQQALNLSPQKLLLFGVPFFGYHLSEGVQKSMTKERIRQILLSLRNVKVVTIDELHRNELIEVVDQCKAVKMALSIGQLTILGDHVENIRV